MPSGRGQLSPEPSKRFKVSRTVEGAKPRRRAISRVGIETENFRRIISRTWRIATLSAGIDRSLDLPRTRLEKWPAKMLVAPNTPGGITRSGGRHHLVMMGGAIP